MSKQKAIAMILDNQFRNLYPDSRKGKTYRQQLRQFEKWLNKNGYKRVTIEEAKFLAKKYIEEKSKSVSNTSLNATVSALIKIFKNLGEDCICVDREYLEYHKHTLAPEKGRQTRIDKDGNEYHGTRPDNQKTARIIAFAKMVGLRESEYKYLRGNDIQIINGKTYVIVRHGKGNKYQWQLIEDECAEAVKAYFDGTNNRVFSDEEISAANQSNLHYYRRIHAQEMEAKYEELSHEDRLKLKELVKEQFARGRDHDIAVYGFDKHKIWSKYLRFARIADVPYVTRKKDGKVYDRLALMATSCLHLSHWRTDVTVSNYMR